MEIRVNWFGKDLVQRNFNLLGAERENNLILLCERKKKSNPHTIAKIHEFLDPTQKYYSLKIRCSKRERKTVFEYVTSLLPLADFYGGVECVYFEFDAQ